MILKWACDSVREYPHTGHLRRERRVTTTARVRVELGRYLDYHLSEVSLRVQMHIRFSCIIEMKDAVYDRRDLGSCDEPHQVLEHAPTANVDADELLAT